MNNLDYLKDMLEPTEHPETFKYFAGLPCDYRKASREVRETLSISCKAPVRNTILWGGYTQKQIEDDERLRRDLGRLAMHLNGLRK